MEAGLWRAVEATCSAAEWKASVCALILQSKHQSKALERGFRQKNKTKKQQQQNNI